MEHHFRSQFGDYQFHLLSSLKIISMYVRKCKKLQSTQYNICIVSSSTISILRMYSMLQSYSGTERGIFCEYNRIIYKIPLEWYLVFEARWFTSFYLIFSNTSFYLIFSNTIQKFLENDRYFIVMYTTECGT